MNSRPSKVLHVLNSATGGAALSTLGLMERFRREGIASCAVCHDAGTQEERNALREMCNGEVCFTTLYWWNKKIRVPRWKRPLSEIKQLLRTGWTYKSTRTVADFARQHQADLIHTNTILTPEGGKAAIQLQLPHVWHVRELVGADAPFPLGLSDQALGRYLAAHCSKLVANSETTASRLRPLVPPDLLTVVLNGIDLDRFASTARVPQSDRLVIGMVGNLTSHWKKHHLVVETATHVDRSLPLEWRFYGHDPSVGGTRPGDAYVDAMHDRLASTGLADRFRFPGFVDDPAIVMSQLDILIHTADQESFGRIIVEAMAAGLPVIGVRGGAVQEIIRHGETGFLAQPDDPLELARYVEQLARDPELRTSMGAAGRKRALAEYSLDASAAGMLKVYEQAMQRPLGTSAAGSNQETAAVE